MDGRAASVSGQDTQISHALRNLVGHRTDYSLALVLAPIFFDV